MRRAAQDMRGLGRIMMYATLVFGAGLVGFSLTTFSVARVPVGAAIAGCGFIGSISARPTRSCRVLYEEHLGAG